MEPLATEGSADVLEPPPPKQPEPFALRLRIRCSSDDIRTAVLALVGRSLGLPVIHIDVEADEDPRALRPSAGRPPELADALIGLRIGPGDTRPTGKAVRRTTRRDSPRPGIRKTAWSTTCCGSQRR